MAVITFIKDSQGWYVDLKNSPFTRKQLAMVRGAATFLDILSRGEKVFAVDVSTSSVPGYSELRRKEILSFGFGGANYMIESYAGQRYNHQVFLCPVTLWIFFRYPKTFYFRVQQHDSSRTVT